MNLLVLSKLNGSEGGAENLVRNLGWDVPGVTEARIFSAGESAGGSDVEDDGGGFVGDFRLDDWE